MPNRSPSRETQRYLLQVLGECRPAAVLQILEMDLGFDMPQFRMAVKRLIILSCGQFLMHARKWTNDPDHRPLQTMCEYDMLWDGFHSTEPYHNSQNQKIKYFMDSNRPMRDREMEAQFVTSSPQ